MSSLPPAADDSQPPGDVHSHVDAEPRLAADPDSNARRGSIDYAGVDVGTSRGATIRAGLRELRDARDIRALAHPTRLALLEALTMNGPLTATQAAAIVGESPSSCSFHLRSLAKHGYVEETGDGAGRNRPWRVVVLGTSISQSDFPDKQSEIAAQGLGELFFERQLERLLSARANRSRLPPEWVNTQSDIESVMWLTPAELRDMNDAMLETVMSGRDRLVDPSLRPEGALPVEVLYFTYRTSIGGTPDPYLPAEDGAGVERGGKKKTKAGKSEAKGDGSGAGGGGGAGGGKANSRKGGRKADRD